MKLTEKVEAVIKAAQAAKDGEGEHTSYRIFKECGLTQGAIKRYVDGDISLMGLGVAEMLGEYYDNHLAK
ncbi:hypothetical protein HXV90_05270 [Lysinibacillus sp. JK80]|uniref:hypothetical protein n=1 Tax=Lysinibacillus TaxID=400634 RepID=UPI00215340BA|nr:MULTISPECIES: hypothetical protein [Lysinibacillus]MCR6522431.1 hypothetical protein [Lysinibacillus capsici]WBF55299.1 hypothetical protein HXV90_05270 [Lysinibacillus sp. JK80]